MLGPWLASIALGAAAIARTDDAAPPPADPDGSDAATLDDDIAFEAFDENELSDLDLEELMAVQVTSVAGVEQSLQATPAAMFVITAEDIRRSGHRSLAEALRMVPGMNVARISSNQWAISARGFNSLFASRMLVLVDGRAIYDPIYSGVLWEWHDISLQDVDRIEVVRGPGATLWGANAVNGVINVTTRSAWHTQGGYVLGGAGTTDLGFGEFRWGQALSDDLAFRVWGKYNSLDHFEDARGNSTSDDWDNYRFGARFDWGDEDETVATLQFEGYGSDRIGEVHRVPLPSHLAIGSDVVDAWFSGGHVLFRIGGSFDEDSNWTLQTYYDHIEADRYGVNLERDTLDVDFRHHFHADERNEIVWGLGGRYSRARIEDAPNIRFRDDDRQSGTVTAFLQDTITLVPDELSLMLGSKFGSYELSGFEFQPTARLSWTPDEKCTIWAAVSRAVRTPARVEDDMTLTLAFADTGLIGGGPPSGVLVPINLRGKAATDAEELIAYELGYRQRLTDDLTVDLAAYAHRYDDFIVVPNTGGDVRNDGSAESYGIEIASNWQLAPNWQLAASYNFQTLDAHLSEGDHRWELGDPHHQAQLRSMLDITDDLEFNAGLYYVDNVPLHDAPAYVRLDLGLTWRPTENVELSIWGQNLLDPSHREYSDDFVHLVPAEVPRGVYAQVRIDF
jgi:iron complex outermembrane receptor protein